MRGKNADLAGLARQETLSPEALEVFFKGANEAHLRYIAERSDLDEATQLRLLQHPFRGKYLVYTLLHNRQLKLGVEAQAYIFEHYPEVRPLLLHRKDLSFEIEKMIWALDDEELELKGLMAARSAISEEMALLIIRDDTCYDAFRRRVARNELLMHSAQMAIVKTCNAIVKRRMKRMETDVVEILLGQEHYQSDQTLAIQIARVGDLSPSQVWRLWEDPRVAVGNFRLNERLKPSLEHPSELIEKCFPEFAAGEMERRGLDARTFKTLSREWKGSFGELLEASKALGPEMM